MTAVVFVAEVMVPVRVVIGHALVAAPLQLPVPMRCNRRSVSGSPSTKEARENALVKRGRGFNYEASFKLLGQAERFFNTFRGVLSDFN